MALQALVPIAIAAGISAGAGGAIRHFIFKDPDAWAPEKVATDAVFGAITGGVFGPVESVVGPAIISRVGATTLGRALASGAATGISVGVADIAEDYLRPAFYQLAGKEKELGEAYPEIKSIHFDPNALKKNALFLMSPATAPLALASAIKVETEQPEGTKPPSIHPEELAISVPLGFGLGALGGAAAAKYEEGKLWIPKIGRAKLGDKSWTGLYAQTGTKAKPIIGVASDAGKIRLSIGQPSYSPFDVSQLPQWADDAAGLAPKTPLERAVFQKAIEQALPEEELPKLMILKVSDKTYHLNFSKAPDKEQFVQALRQSDRLRDVADDIVAWLNRQRDFTGIIKAQPYGSTVQKAYLGEQMSRTPADLDLSVPNPEKAAKELVNILTKKGIKVRISPQHPTLIERYMNGKWVHLIDIHGASEASAASGAASPYFGWGYRTQQPAFMQMDNGKMPVMRITEQGARKVASTLQVWKEGKVAPEPHRVKDIIDAYEVQKYLVQHLPQHEREAANQILEQWINTFKDLVAPAQAQAAQIVSMYSRSLSQMIPSYLGYIFGPMAVVASQPAPQEPSEEPPSEPSGESSQPPSEAPSPELSQPSQPPSQPSTSPSFFIPYPSIPYPPTTPSPSPSVSAPSAGYPSIASSPVLYHPPSAAPAAPKVPMPSPEDIHGRPRHYAIQTIWVPELL